MRRLLCAVALACLAAGARAADSYDRDEPHRVVEAISRLRLPDRKARLRALKTIERFARKAIPHLVRATRDENPLFRARVAHALGLVGKGDRSALLALTSLLTDPDAFVRREAIAAIVEAGGAAQIASIEALLDDRVAAVRVDAVAAIAALEPPRANGRLAALLKHRDARVRRAALGQLVRRAPPGLPELVVALLPDPDPAVRAAALGALSRLRGPQACPTLIRLLKDADPRVRAAAVSALKQLAPLTRDPKTMTTEQRRQEAEKARLASQAVPHILALLEDPAENVRLAAIAALGLLADPRVAEAPLLSQLTAPSRRVRGRAALALAFLFGPVNKRSRTSLQRVGPAVRALVALLNDEEPAVRQKAHLALRFILGANVRFEASGSEEQRQEAIVQWRQAYRDAVRQAGGGR